MDEGENVHTMTRKLDFSICLWFPPFSVISVGVDGVGTDDGGNR